VDPGSGNGVRILQVNKFYDPRGGTERVLFDLEDGLRERGHEVGVFAGEHPDNRETASPIWLVPERNYENPSLRERVGHAVGTLYDQRARKLFRAALDSFDPDVVHLHNIYHQLSPSILDELYDRQLPAVMTVHDYKLVCPVYRLYRHGEICERCVGRDFPIDAVLGRCSRGSLAESALLALESSWHRRRASYPRALDSFLAPSRFLADKLVEGGLPSDRIHVVRNAPRQVPALAAKDALATDPTFLYAGRLSDEKGVDLLVRATARCPRVHLRIAGAGPEEAALRKFASGMENVTFLGHLGAEELARERAASWATLVPSRWYENAPMSVIESWCAGRAVLGSGHGGLAEMIGDGEAGRVVEPTTEAWVGALTEAASDRDAIAALGARARERATREHAFDDLLDRVIELYREAIDD
jgi:glycosyltransferase involved in cell wall biosynthesis